MQSSRTRRKTLILSYMDSPFFRVHAVLRDNGKAVHVTQDCLTRGAASWLARLWAIKHFDESIEIKVHE